MEIKMKILLALSAVILFCMGTFAQTAPESFLTMLPDYPSSFNDEEDIDLFLKKIENVVVMIDEEVQKQNEQTKLNSENFDEKASKESVKQLGITISPSDMKKLKGKKLNESEKKEMVDKMLQQNQNMSLEEVEKLKNMSEEGKKAWAEGYSSEQIAEAEANKDKNDANNKKNINIVELSQELTFVTQKIQAADKKFADKLQEFDKMNEKNIELRELCYKSVEENYKDRDLMIVEKKNCYRNYLAVAVPEYKNVIDHRLSDLKSLSKEYYRLDEINNILFQSTSGSKQESVKPGATYLKAINKYADSLKRIP